MNSQLRKIFLDICQGYTEAQFKDKPIFFKHLGDREQILIDEHQQEWNARLLKLGAASRQDKLAAANKEKTWTTPQEASFNAKQKELTKWLSNKPKFRSIQQIDGFFEVAEEYRKEIIEMAGPRNQALTGCAEDTAAFEAYNHEIGLSCFADKGLSVPFFECYDDIEDSDALKLHELYYQKLSFIRNDGFKELKRLCCQDFFYNKFWITDNSFYFLNKPLWSLSQLQMYLLSFGKRYVEVLKYCNKAPERFYDEPEKLECYALMVQDKGEDDEETSGQMQANIRNARGGK